MLRRHRLYRADGKPDFHAMERDQFLEVAADELACIQRELHAEALRRRDANIHRGVDSFEALAAFYREDQRYPGWVELAWSRPSGAELDAVTIRLKALKLTIRNAPMGGVPVSGNCIFTGKPAVEQVYVARAY